MTLGPPAILANRIISELGIDGPEELDIDVIAKFCGATIRYRPLDGCAGRVLGRVQSGRAVITVDNRAAFGRQRFTAAHELGHWLYDRGAVMSSCADEVIARPWKTPGRENRANAFAAELLLPRFLVGQQLAEGPLSFDAVVQIRELFATSITATAIRLVELARFPAMLICNAHGKRSWFCRGGGVPERLFPSERPGRATRVARMRLEVGERQSGTVCADEWFDLPAARGHEVHEDSLVVVDRQSLTLLTWPDEGLLLGLIDEEEDGAGNTELGFA
jgi:hypothetical protein